MDLTLLLADLLTARVFHDLAGPLSGLCAAMGELPGDTETLALAKDAELALRGRFALLRAARGEASAPLEAAEVQALARGIPGAHRFAVILDIRPANAAFAPAAARVVLNVLLMAAESLPRGGTIALAGNPAGQVIATINGPHAAWPGGLGAMLASADVTREALAKLQNDAGLSGLQAPLTALFARAAGVRVGFLMGRTAVDAAPLLIDFSGTPPA
jgi:histidine phosphotransferase ChpT